MSSRLTIAVLIYSMIQGVLFGVGVVLVLATPLQQQAMILLPAVVIGSAILALPFSWGSRPGCAPATGAGAVSVAISSQVRQALRSADCCRCSSASKQVQTHQSYLNKTR